MKGYILPPLSPAVFYILLALVHKDRHGYDIMHKATDYSDNIVIMSPGTLYGTLKRMLDDHLIEHSTVDPAQESDDQRRKYYHLTAGGKQILGHELERYEKALKIARQHKFI